MTGVGVVFSAIFLLGVLFFRRDFVWVVLLAAPFHDTALIDFQRVTVSPYFAALMVLILIQSYSWLSNMSTRTTGAVTTFDLDPVFLALAALFAYGLSATVIGPALFFGTPVAVAGAGLDEQVGRLSSLDYSVSNWAQIIYLALNLFLVAHLANYGRGWRAPLKVALLAGLLVASTDVVAVLAGVEWPHWFFDSENRISANLARVVTRARGQFTEPSHLAAFALASLVYLATGVWRERGVWARRVSVGGSLLALLCLIYSASGTGLIGSIVAGASIILILLLRILVAGRVNAGFVGAAAILVCSTPFAFVYLSGLLSDMLAKKSSTGSYRNRGYADANSIDVFYRTAGLGSGLGSNRGSSLLLMLLATVGIVGVLLFTFVVFRLVFRLVVAGSKVLHAPACWALLAYVSALFVSYADFASAVLWVLIACCYCDYKMDRDIEASRSMEVSSAGRFTALVR